MVFVGQSRWGDLHPGDVVRGRDGKRWTITERERESKQGSGWLSRSGDRHDIFALRCEDGREIKAGRPIGEMVPLLSRADRSEIQSACDALSSAGFDAQMIMEGSSVTAPLNPCQHPADQLSTLNDKRVYCTACFETVRNADGTPATPTQVAIVDLVPNMAPLTDHPPQCTCPRPECVALFIGEPAPAQDYAAPSNVASFEAHRRERVAAAMAVAAAAHPGPRFGLDVNGVQWPIPDHLDDSGSCGFGVHPISLLVSNENGPPAGSLCVLCDAVLPGVAPPIPLPDEVVAVLSDPPATVVVVNEPAPAQGDVFEFDNPADKPEPEDTLIKNKRYYLPHPETGQMTYFTRASTLAKILASDYLLHQWELREVAFGIAISPDLIALAASCIRDDPTYEAETRKTLTEVVRKAKARAKLDARANLGTALHGFTHRHARGETIEQMRVPEALRADVNAYKHALKMHGLTEIPDLVERTVVSLSLGVAGTFDRVVHQRPTSTNPHPVPYTILDLKTGKSLDFSLLEFAVQLAIYANGDYLYDRVTKTWVPFPGPDVLDRDRALLLHLPVGMANPTLWAIDIHKGWKLAHTSEDGRQARNNAKGFGWLIEPDPETLLIHRVSKAEQAELAQLWERHHNDAQLWTATVNQAALDRMAELAAVPA